jgi:hypothetical protein
MKQAEACYHLNENGKDQNGLNNRILIDGSERSHHCQVDLNTPESGNMVSHMEQRKSQQDDGGESMGSQEPLTPQNSKYSAWPAGLLVFPRWSGIVFSQGRDHKNRRRRHHPHCRKAAGSVCQGEDNGEDDH